MSRVLFGLFLSLFLALGGLPTAESKAATVSLGNVGPAFSFGSYSYGTTFQNSNDLTFTTVGINSGDIFSISGQAEPPAGGVVISSVELFNADGLFNPVGAAIATGSIVIGGGTTNPSFNLVYNALASGANYVVRFALSSLGTNSVFNTQWTLQSSGNEDVPIPGAFFLLISGFAGLGLLGWKRRNIASFRS